MAPQWDARNQTLTMVGPNAHVPHFLAFTSFVRDLVRSLAYQYTGTSNALLDEGGALDIEVKVYGRDSGNDTVHEPLIGNATIQLTAPEDPRLVLGYFSKRD